MANDVALTPMMKQYFEFKAQHPDAVLLFRCGDFYETYSEDAVVASDILGITLTKRSNSGQGKVVEMAGFPHHALDTYLPKLIRAGKRVAICDQLEDPKLTKKLVKRGITELVTPGVSINDNVLNYKENNFLAAVHFGKTACGVAFLDISTGEFLTAEGTTDYVDKLLSNFAPKEVLFERGRRAMFEGNFGSKFVVFEMDDWVFTEQTAMQKLLKHFETKNLKGFGVDHLKMGIIASGAILEYLEMTQHTQLGHITSLARIEEDRYVRLDKFTVRSLELVSSMNEGGTSLLDVIDHTISPMGARLLKRWMVFPLTSEAQINERLDMVEYFLDKTKGRIPMSYCDVQSPLNTLSNIIDSNQFYMDFYLDPDSMKKAMDRTADLLIDFTRAQQRLIGDALAKPGHGFASSRTFDGLGMSDDTITMLSPDLYVDMAVPAMAKAGDAFGGTVFHSCGNWSDKKADIVAIKNIRMADGAFSKATDPGANPTEGFADTFAGTGVVLNARIVGDPELVEAKVKELWKPGMKLIVVTYCETPEEQAEVYDRIHAICR